VNRVTYSYHRVRNSEKPAMLRVSYYTDNILTKPVTEMLCFEHEGSARTRAHNWWIERVPPEGKGYMPVPATIAEALKLTQWLRTPAIISVWTNAPHPRIMSYEY
jgi:DNA repair protein RadD